MKKKTHEEYIQELSIKRPNIIVLGQYVDSRKKILVKCKVCDYEWEVVPNTLVSTNSGCPRCANHEPLNTKTFREKAELKNTKIKILGEYIYHKEKIKVQCVECGEIWYMLPSNILHGQGCRKCYKASKQNMVKPPEIFKQEMSMINPNIILLEEYKRSNVKIKCSCKICGYEWNVVPSSLLRGSGCIQCYLKNKKGENNPNWNPNLSDEDRIKRRHYHEYTDWSKSVLKRDNYTCVLSDVVGTDLVAHHLDGYNWCKEKRLDIDNGITLSKIIHKEFHTLFGYGDNTKEQFIEFIQYKRDNNSITNDKYNNLINYLTV